MTQHKFTSLACLLLLLSQGAVSQTESSNVAHWSELRYEAKSMWATALTKLSLTTENSADFGEVQRLLLEGSVAKNSERDDILLAPDSKALLKRDHLTRGKNQRMKQYAYSDDTVTRTRRERDAAGELPPENWPVSSERKLVRPSLQECPVLTAMPALLMQVHTVSAQPDQTLTTCVHSDDNFYRVQMKRSGEEKVKVNYKLAEGKVSGKQAADVITVSVERVGTPAGDMDFSLLGLSTPLTILVGTETQLPLQVRGKAPRIGDAEINLVGAVLTPSTAE